MTDKTFTDYLTEAGALPDAALLGKIVLFTITDEPVAHDDIVDAFSDLGLNPALLPGRIRELDAFKKATTDAKRTYPMSREREGFTLCRDVTSTSEYCRRQITREIKDGRSKRLSYDAAIDCTYFKATSPTGNGRVQLNVRLSDVEAEEVTELEALAKQIAVSYDRYANFHDGQKLRGVVRNYIRHLNGIEIKGGVYFVHQSKDVELQALAKLVRGFGGGCMLNTIPMVDLEQDREFIASVFEREASQELENIAREARALVDERKGTITDAAFLKLKQQFDDVLVKANEHMVNLQCTQDLTAASAEVALAAIQKLQLQMVAA